MPRPPLPFRLVFFCVAAALAAVGPARAATSSAKSAAPWQAVLVAGDDAQPVFDNAVSALSRVLEARGVPDADIHRLSADRRPGQAGVEPATDRRILAQIAALRPGRGGRCLVYITSHGGRGEGIWLAASRDFLQPGALARALSAGCGAVPTVAILSSCYSGAFTKIRAPNRIVLTAARADRPSFGCQANRTYTVYDECLLAALPKARTWRAVYRGSTACVRRNEKRLDMLPSRPQAAFGAAVRNLTVR